MKIERTEVNDRLAILNLISAVNDLHRAVTIATKAGAERNEEVERMIKEALNQSFESLKLATDAEVRTAKVVDSDD